MAAPTVQMIDGEGEFHEEEVKQFVASTGVADSRANYQVVAIMGPQSSGKSTLMNHLVSGRRGSRGSGARPRGAAPRGAARSAPARAWGHTTV